MNHLLEEIAHKLKTIKFLRMNVMKSPLCFEVSYLTVYVILKVSSCGIEVDRVALPILNIYK
jgi:hypothetical protein